MRFGTSVWCASLWLQGIFRSDGTMECIGSRVFVIETFLASVWASLQPSWSLFDTTKVNLWEFFVGLVRGFVPMYFPLPGVSGASFSDDLLLFWFSLDFDHPVAVFGPIEKQRDKVLLWIASGGKFIGFLEFTEYFGMIQTWIALFLFSCRVSQHYCWDLWYFSCIQDIELCDFKSYVDFEDFPANRLAV